MQTTEDAKTSSTKIPVWGLIEDVGKVVGRNMLPLTLIALPLLFAPEAVTGWLLSRTGADDAVRSLVSTLLASTFGIVATMAIIHLVLRDLRGESTRVGEAFAVGARLFFPALAISLVAGLGMMVGLILLIVPGVILMLAWSVILPWRADRGPGVFGALKGSRALTKGSRWRILGASLLGFLCLLLLLLPVIIVGAIMDLMGGAGLLANDVILTPLTTAITTPLVAVFSVALYEALQRRERALTAAAADA